jgi:hypothetical protein
MHKGRSLPRRNRGPRENRRAPAPVPPSWQTKSGRHPLFGKIPLVRQATAAPNGKVYEWWIHDPTYEPPLPVGAVRGNAAEQVYCKGHHVPKYFYVDEDRECIQCGSPFTFRAAEQKHWYEVLKFNFDSVPIRCLRCRRQRRSEHALREAIARAKALARERSDDPAAHLSLAAALVEYHERTGQGDLNAAIAAARRASASWPQSAEPLFWEGMAHARAGRDTRARRCLEGFVSRSDGSRPMLVKKARAYLGGR